MYQEFTGQKKISCGRQADETIPGIIDFVLPSPSGLNRTPYVEQLAYYQQLKDLAETEMKTLR